MRAGGSKSHDIVAGDGQNAPTAIAHPDALDFQRDAGLAVVRGITHGEGVPRLRSHHTPAPLDALCMPGLARRMQAVVAPSRNLRTPHRPRPGTARVELACFDQWRGTFDSRNGRGAGGEVQGQAPHRGVFFEHFLQDLGHLTWSTGRGAAGQGGTRGLRRSQKNHGSKEA